MKLKLIATLIATSLAGAALMAPPVSAAGKKPAAAKAGGPAGTLTKTIPLAPPGLKWGMSLEQVARLYDKELEKAFKPEFLKAGNSPKVLELEEDLKMKQGVLRRSRVDFADTPTGIDQSPLKGEYSYGNGESLARVTPPSGTTRNFFFFKDKLWKVYDEHKLSKDSPLGEDFDSAVKALTKRFGDVAPQKVSADFAKGQAFDEAVWRDGEKVIRAVDRGNILGMVYADKSIQENLASYRKNQPVDQHALDKDVAAATKNPPTQITGPKEPEKDAKGGKKDAKKK